MSDYDLDMEDAELFDDIESDYEEDDYEIDDDVEDAVDDMLDAMIDSAEEDEDPEEMADFFWRKKKRKSKRYSRRGGRRIPYSKGRSTYRKPRRSRYVTQPQLKVALAKVGKEHKRNALGIRSLNRKLSRTRSGIAANTKINRIQSTQISKINKLNKADGVLEFVAAYDTATQSVDAFQLLKGAVKSGMIGTGKGGLSNPYIIGGLGLLLNNSNLLGNLVGTTDPIT